MTENNPAEMSYGQMSGGGNPVNDYPHNGDGIMDFTPHRPQVQFRINDDVFYGKAEVPTLTLMKYGARAQAMATDDADDGIQSALELLRMMLRKDSADLLINRLEDDENPVGIESFNKLVPWLMEQYGMRPTEPSSDSSDGSPNQDGGTNSTGNSRGVESTSSR